MRESVLIEIFFPVNGNDFSQFKILSQVFVPDFRIGRQFICSSAFQNASFVQQVSPVRDSQCLVYIVIGDDHPDVFGLELGYNLLNIFHGNRVNSGKRFIQQNKFGVKRQSPGNFTTAAFSPESWMP